MSKTNVSRRSFLKGAALGAVGAGVAGTGLIGCSPAETTQGENVSSAGGGEEATVNPQAAFAQLNPQDFDFRDNTITDFSQTKIFSEWSFGGITLPHRIVKSAAGSAYLPFFTHEMLVDEYTTLAKNGVDFIWIEDYANLLEHYPAFYKEAGREDARLDEVIEAIHKEGSFCGYQLSLMGASFSGFDAEAAEEFECAHADDLTLEEVHIVQEDFINAAVFLKEQGVDAVELNAAGNNIGQAFLSRNRNARTDDYGTQTFENRARFVSEIVQGIKEKCGQDFPVQILINAVEENDVTLGNNSMMTTVEENLEIAKMLEKAGVDSLHVRLGPYGYHPAEFASDLYFTGYGIDGVTGFGTQFDFSRHFQGKLIGSHSGCGMLLDIGAEFKKAVSIPVGLVTFMDPAHAPDYFEQALQDEKADFLLMTRPLYADPEYITKLKEGRIDEIAPCNRCLHCHFDLDEEGVFYEHCRVNACHMRAFTEAMPEGPTPLPAEGSKKVMVIGGGPAGMEAARIAAQRGYEVSLYEEDGTLGGLLDFAYLVKGPHENIQRLRDYLIRQLEINNVEVVTGQKVDAEYVKQANPDIVIVATGGLRNTLGLESTNSTQVVAIEDALNPDIGDTITIIGSNVQSVDIALYLLAQGKKVTMVSSDPIEKLGKGQSDHVKDMVLPMLYARGVRVWPNAEVKTIGDGEITIQCDTGVDMTFACDAVVEAMDMMPDVSLSGALPGVDVYSVGDCDNPFNIAEAIGSGNMTARKI